VIIELAKLIDTIVGVATPMVQEKLQRSELVIKLLKQFHLDPDHPPADFTAVYQYTLVEYGIGKPKYNSSLIGVGNQSVLAGVGSSHFAINLATDWVVQLKG
jgi:hypothetical protein